MRSRGDNNADSSKLILYFYSFTPLELQLLLYISILLRVFIAGTLNIFPIPIFKISCFCGFVSVLLKLFVVGGGT